MAAKKTAPAARTAAAEPATARGEQTKQLIVETAMRLFREHGYEQTTMRAIAREAGVSVGNAYYYFASKEHLIQAFYEDIQVGAPGRPRELLAASKTSASGCAARCTPASTRSRRTTSSPGSSSRPRPSRRSPLHPLSTESTRGAVHVDRAVPRGVRGLGRQGRPGAARRAARVAVDGLPGRDPVLGARPVTRAGQDAAADRRGDP